MSKKPAALGASIIATKGNAFPAVKSEDNPVANQNVDNEHRTAVTVRLDDVRYKKLKLFGLDHKLSNQDIIVAALDAYLE